jgi:hypothetical protein
MNWEKKYSNNEFDDYRFKHDIEWKSIVSKIFKQNEIVKRLKQIIMLIINIMFTFRNDSISDFKIESNWIKCQRIKSLIFRFDSIFIDLKSIEIEIFQQTQKRFQLFFFYLFQTLTHRHTNYFVALN